VTADVLELRDLTAVFDTDDGTASVLNGVDITIRKGEMVGLVGESGAGKSVLVMTIIGLLRKPGRVTGGSIVFQGRDLRTLDEEALEGLRGRELSMVMQNARSALDPLRKVGDQIASVYRFHTGASDDEARAKALAMIDEVRIPDAARIAGSRAHQLSGGMAQRISIAMALVCSPTLLLADEPTTGLDVTVQRQILDLTRDLLKRDQRAMLLVTHDLGVVAHYCDTVAVMYAGRIIESVDVERFFDAAVHPYTLHLISAVSYEADLVERTAIGSHFLDLTKLPSGCHFHPRCPLARDRCLAEAPAAQEIAPGHHVCCHNWREARQRVDGAAA
jgi:oligopeptide transport system ATP-binding protein